MEYRFPTDEFISGVSGSQEKACQDMIIAAMQWTEANPAKDPQFGGWPSQTTPINQDAQELLQVMDQAGGDVDTEAMRHLCVTHVQYARRNGWLKYIQDMAEAKTAQ